MPDTDAVLDWPELIRAALERARGGASKPVPGARLRPVVATLAADRGVDLTTYLREQGLTFADLIERHGRLTVVRRVGTDMLVAATPDEVAPEDLSPTARPSPIRRDFIRPDLYDAVTRFGTGLRAIYNPNDDRVLHIPRFGEIPAGWIALPTPTFEEEVAERRRFAEEHQSDALLQSLAEERPLTAFREALERENLLTGWREWKTRAIRDKLISWAAENRVEMRADWFGGTTAPSRGDHTPTAAEVLKLVADYMSEEELRGISVPLRAVQAFLAQHPSARNSS